MKDEEKQRKFHDALLKMLYPPPPSPPPCQEDQEEEEERNLADTLNCLPEEELENEESHSSPSSGEAEKLTRAQRKRRRKKKLREAAAARRRKIIGPQLPGSNGNGGNDDEINVQSNVPESVGRNTAKGADAATDFSGETTCCGSNSKQNKVNQRRKLKKLGAGKKDDYVQH